MRNTANIVPRIEENTAEWDEQMSRYLDHQSSIARCSHVAHDPSTNENRVFDLIRGFDNDSIAGSP